MLIYKATNLVNDKVYIGKTIQEFDSRKQAHIKEALSSKCKKYFHRAIRKYGVNNFTWEVVCQYWCVTEKELGEYEKYYIKKYDSFGENGYNMTVGGEGSEGHIVTDEVKELISKKCTGYKHTDKAKEKIGNASKGNKYRLGKTAWNKGLKMSEDFCKKASESHIGIKQSEESKKKKSESLRDEKHWNYRNDLNTEEIINYLKTHTFIETAENFNCSTGCIDSRVRKNKLEEKRRENKNE